MGQPPQIMGVLNVTPDSFSDGGDFLAPQAAIAHGLTLAAEGAAIVDVGGESTRPGSQPVPLAEELRRVLPVVEGLKAAGLGTTISIDTRKAEVARRALEAGATFVNDISALRFDLAMAGCVASFGARCCLVHMSGEPATMQREPRYRNVVDEVRAFLEERVAFAVREGIPEEHLVVDPGIGFGKRLEHNLALLSRLDRIAALGLPVLIGTSRKSFLGELAGRQRGTVPPPKERVGGTIASNLIAYLKGARIFRVHAVGELADAFALLTATLAGDGTG